MRALSPPRPRRRAPAALPPRDLACTADAEARQAGSRVLVVSNRLPVTVHTSEDGPRLDPSSGGLATGLCGPHERTGGLWIGWPGDLDGLDPATRAKLHGELEARRLVPVELTGEEVRRYYEGFANGVLWPLFHYEINRLPLVVEDWEAYEAVNQRFADAVVEQYQPGDRIWVHDYQLMRVPALIRRRLPEARIGFFLHIPFPASEVFRTLPYRDRLLAGLLGADLIGFHTASYMRHFSSSVLRVLGAVCDVDRVHWKGCEVRLGVFPMGIDAEAFARTAATPSVLEQVRELRSEEGLQILLGIDRLDYTKGIPRRLLAFERLLQHHPELRERVRLIQVAVPSREDVVAYRDFRSLTDELIGRIHGAFATPRWVPVHWIYRALSREEVVALYRAADVLLVTPLRDGMNLVAKEFVASRIDDDGVLLLSEFAGAAAELAEAVPVNPFDVEATAEACHRALCMPEDERRTRMQALRVRVLAFTADRWAERFLALLAELPPRGAAPADRARPAPVRELVERLRAAPALLLLLDYDGTLVPFAPAPDLARPDRELLALLAALASRPATEVHVISGRTRATLERWLGGLPLTLHAEHGLFSRRPGAPEWSGAEPVDVSWHGPVRRILEEFAARTPGSLVEEKSAALAWHYRAAETEFGERQAKELHLHLREMLSNLPVEILPGHKVIEVRAHGAHKGAIVPRLVERLREDGLLVAIGDDRTDEDLFAALPADALTIHVGSSPSRARLRLAGVGEVRALLRALTDTAPEGGAG